MKNCLGALVLSFTCMLLKAQVGTDSSGASPQKAKLSVEGYVDVYYSYAFSHPEGGTRPYFVSYNRDNEINLDLAYVSLKYTSDRVRATLTPGYGTYMNANYASERQTLQNILEANVGIRLLKNADIWLDAGVISSPYTNETTYSLDQITYTRSLGAENTPYYLTGAKLSVPLGARWTAFLYVLNGWQVVESQHDPLDYGSQLEYKPNGKWDINWNTYIGNESSTTNPAYRTRYFGEVYAVYNPSVKWALSGDVYAGGQRVEEGGPVGTHKWWNANLCARLNVDKVNSFSARVEYFHDPSQVLVKSVAGDMGFTVSGASLGYNRAITDNVLFRLESRYFLSPSGIYPLRDKTDANEDLWMTVGLTARLK